MSAIRPPAVAGMFYPADAGQLAGEVQGFLTHAHPFNLIPKALIVPHAGYIYSGAIAATAYATLIPVAGRIHRVVLLGPTHRVAVRGLALPGVDAFDIQQREQHLTDPHPGHPATPRRQGAALDDSMTRYGLPAVKRASANAAASLTSP